MRHSTIPTASLIAGDTQHVLPAIEGRLLQGLRFIAGVLAVAVMLGGMSPDLSALAQTPPAASAALSEATVKALQEALTRQGIAVKADGVLNDETRAAIRTYQSQHHLPVTGEPDTATLGKLGVRPSAAAAPSPTLAQAAPAAPPAASPPAQAQTPSQSATQPGQTQGGMMMNCPMMQGMMQGPMQGMMQNQMMQMMQGMMQMMQTMQAQMQMMQGQMQMMQGQAPGQTSPGQTSPGQTQPGQPGQMQPGQMQPGQMQPGTR